MKSRRKITEGNELQNQESNKTLGNKENYKFLEILEADTIKQTEIYEKIRKENLRRARKQQKSHQRINIWVVSLVRYAEPFLKCTREELRLFNQRRRKLMTTWKALHQRDDIDRLYVSRREGRRGLTNIEYCVYATTVLSTLKREKKRLKIPDSN